ncbi:MAG: NAD(P)/FAD-dependent oxidoreductase [Streptococcaceae bacterium]|nr:NAD(P)/FAD-dependent oxidoreductase [Streptococcaceae bacterium]
MEMFDITVVGAGPVGLYAGFYAGMKGLSVHILDVAEAIGGQPMAIYPEKKIYDIAGVPEISGGELAENLQAQLRRVPHTLSLGQKVEKIEQRADGNFLLKTSAAEFLSRSVLLTTGNGLITPRKIGVDGEDAAHDSGRLSYNVSVLEEYREKTVVILGGGDSALDWALMLEPIAKEVHVVHRRDKFRAHAKTVADVAESSVNLHTPFTVSALTESGLSLQKVKSDERLELSADKVLVSYGSITSVLDVMDALDVTRNNKIPVSQEMASNISGIFAAGDVVEYREAPRVKVPLISVGFGEAVTAVSAIARQIDFGHKLTSGHSSTLFEKEEGK